MDLLEFMMELDIQQCLALKNMTLFAMELDKPKMRHDIYFFLTILQKSKLILMIFYL